MPLFFDFVNSGSTEEKVAKFKKQAQAIGLDFPVLVKLQQGATTTYAHTFFCINNENGLTEALDFDGYKNEMLLIQAYRPHMEQVYKIYCIKGWYNAEIRLSLPEKIIFGADAYKFDS